MVTITQVASGELALKSNYYYSDRIRQMPTARWSPETKQWYIQKAALPALELEFMGELVYKTPRWVIMGEPMPDMSKMYQIQDQSISVPETKVKLFDYQNYGVKFVIDKIKQFNWVIEADDVGLGKTAVSITAFKWFYEHEGNHKLIVVCKKSVKKQWADEIKKFTDLDTDFWIGYTGDTAAKRTKAYKEFVDANSGILITNHHTFLNDYLKIKACNPDFMIIDEVHAVKTRGGKMHDRIEYVANGLPIIFLTGTPIMSRPEDIYGIVEIADDKYFGNWKEFSERYITYAPNRFKFNAMEPVGAKHLDELREKTQNIVIRRTSYEVSIELPKISMVRRDVEMDDVQSKCLEAIRNKQMEYHAQLSDIMKMPDTPERQEKVMRIEAMSKGLIASTQAAATDPRLFAMSTSKVIQKDFAPLVPKDYKGSAKTKAILELVEDILNSGRKVILFTKFKTAATLIANEIRNYTKQEVLTYTGNEGQDLRDKYVDLFRNTDVYNILIGTEAMSDSLNLQVANFVINIDQPDTFATKTQRIGRARRTGSQFDTVTVYDMITEGSKDEERLENIRKNMDLTDALISLDEAQRKALVDAMKNE